MTFAENLNRICKEKGTTLTAVVQSIGLSTSKVSYWNNGSLPKEEVMVELAKKLECSVMDFFADEDDTACYAPPNRANPNHFFFMRNVFGFVLEIEVAG